ncbi:MAG: DUF2141 domain-containing protein [Flavobacteriales bacterium]
MKKPLKALSATIKDGKAIATFTSIEAGTYAIILFHDKNGNKIMDFEPSGMPIEMFGVSNNVMNFGPTKWEDAKFEVTNTPVDLEIRL